MGESINPSGSDISMLQTSCTAYTVHHCVVIEESYGRFRAYESEQRLGGHDVEAIC